MLPWPGATIILLQYSKLKLTLAFFFIADKINTCYETNIWQWFVRLKEFGEEWFLKWLIWRILPKTEAKKAANTRNRNIPWENVSALNSMYHLIYRFTWCTICLLGFAYLLVHFPFRWALSCSSSTSHISVDPTSSPCAGGKMCNEGSGISGRYWLCQMRNPQ